MSYVPAFAPDARSQWREVDIPLQETVLDEVERLCASPPEATEHVADLVLDRGDIRHYLFIHVTLNEAKRQLTVVGVGYYSRRRVG